MTLLAAAFCLALTRAEIIERMRAPSIVKVNGLVEVVANCPAEMRREFQLPIASFVAEVCTSLYTALGEKPVRFEEAAIVVTIGEVRTNDTAVIVRQDVRTGGAPCTRIHIPAPAFADTARVRLETAKAFYRAVKGETIDDVAAVKALRTADPRLKIEDRYRELDLWRRGTYGESADDEHYLKLARSVLEPGVARVSDVLRFASRLYLYPEVASAPFCGKYSACSFREAIALAKDDARIRFIAYLRSPGLVVRGGGHGEALQAAATAYSEFLRELAGYRKTPEELGRMLDDADEKLNSALEAARNLEKESKR